MITETQFDTTKIYSHIVSVTDYLAQAIFKAVEYDFHNLTKKIAVSFFGGRKKGWWYIQLCSQLTDPIRNKYELARQALELFFASLLWRVQAKCYLSDPRQMYCWPLKWHVPAFTVREGDGVQASCKLHDLISNSIERVIQLSVLCLYSAKLSCTLACISCNTSRNRKHKIVISHTFQKILLSIYS